MAAEIGAICIALELVTGIGFRWWALPTALGIWLLLWKGTFGFIEKGVSFLGLITVVFIVGTVRLHPSFPQLALRALPSLPHNDQAQYWFIAVSILGASITPYLMYFYSSGAIEDVPHLLGTERGICTGHDEIRKLFAVLAERKPEIRQFYRADYSTDGKKVIWEYPQTTPEGEQMDFVEVMEIEYGLIQHHRVYWGWFGIGVLNRNEYR